MPKPDPSADTVQSSETVSVRVLVDYLHEGALIKNGSIIKTTPAIANGLVAGGVADDTPEAVAYAIDNNGDTVEI